MAKESGSKFLIAVGNGASTEVFHDLKGQADGSIDQSSSSIDVTDKTNNGWASKIAGLKSASVSVSGTVDWPDTDGFERIQQAFLDSEPVNLEVKLNSTGKKVTGSFTIDSFNCNGGVNGATSYSVSFSNNGELTYV